MIKFDDLLKKHGWELKNQVWERGSKRLKYLWQIKVTDEEYNDLKQSLAEQAGRSNKNCNNRFILFHKECLLYIAEFWRREYKGSAHSKEMIIKSLNITYTKELETELFEAAKKGLNLLRLDIFKGKGGNQYLDSMLYQGGLPMQLVTNSEYEGVWDRFTRGLIHRKIDFKDPDLKLGIVASQSQSLKDYCNELISGVELGQYLRMPFYCQNEDNNWFTYLRRVAKEEKNRHAQTHPFTLDWEFKVKKEDKKICINYVVNGVNHLPQELLKEQQLENVDFFSVCIRKNGQLVDTFDYVNNFCRDRIISRHPYSVGDNISVFIHNQIEPQIADDLDMNIPHLLCRNEDGNYKLGNQIGMQESLLLIPEGWTVENEQDLSIIDYKWGEIRLKGIELAADYQNDIVVKSEDGTITFGKCIPLYWTEMLTHPLYLPDVIEPLYDANKCTFTLRCDTEGRERQNRSRVQFRNKWQKEWSDTPSYGEIFARAVNTDGSFVTPKKFINIGDGLKIGLVKAEKDSCQLKVSWAHGHVSTTEGQKKINDEWEIQKKDCSDPRRIRFTLTPEENGLNQFSISIKAPFKDFTIINIDDKEIEDNCWIPYSDIDQYQYHLIGQNVKRYTYGNFVRELKWEDNRLYIFDEKGRSIKSIPYEDSLLILFDSREVLRSILDRTSQNMLNAEIKVEFILENGKHKTFAIKDSPFRPKQEKNRVVITGNNKEPIEYTGDLKLLKLDDPDAEPIIISRTEEPSYYDLQDIHSWGKAILIGDGETRGRIYPLLVDTDNYMDSECRHSVREAALKSITEEIPNSHIGDKLWKRIMGWFERAWQEGIPASSILELSCTATNYQALLCMVFQLYASSDDRVELKEQLKSFSSDLAFQWYWLSPYISEILKSIDPFIKDPRVPEIIRIYIKWALKKENEDKMKYLSIINDENAYEYEEAIGTCLMEIIDDFCKWLKDLCVDSMLDAYKSVEDSIAKSCAETIVNNPKDMHRVDELIENYIDFNQKDLDSEVDSEVTTFFDKYNKMGKGKPANEVWFYKRVEAVVAHLKKEVNLFTQKEEIRRSIIYCSKSCNNQFIKALNNKLIK